MKVIKLIILFLVILLSSNYSSARITTRKIVSKNDSKKAKDSEKALLIDYLKDKKPAVSMSHHNDWKCTDCHHYGGTVPCGNCHKARVESNVNSKIAPPALSDEKGNKNIFHELCIACHKKEDKGPLKCAECHSGRL